MPDSTTTIGRYQIKKKVGEGAAGKVYLAIDPVLKRQVAIKLPKLDDGRNEVISSADEFYAEAVMGGQFHHPNIVTILDVGRDRNIDYLVMEYVDGLSLAQHIKMQQRLPVAFCLQTAYRICLALDYMHYNNTAHRDIKPANIMLDLDHDLVKVMDFSSAARLSELSSKQTGTAPYMAPELHQPGHLLDVHSDIFALGAVLYEMLTGEMAFAATDPMACVYRVINEPPTAIGEYRDDVPGGVIEIVDRSLQKDPSKRYQNVLEFADALQRELDKVSSGDQAQHRDKDVHYLKLRRDVWFKNFSPDQVKELMDAGEVKLYADGQKILVEGQKNDSFYIVLEGTVKIFKSRYRIRKLGEGECFGEISYLKGTPATATVTASGDVMLWNVSPGFLDGVSSETQLGFYKAFLDMVIERLTRGNQDIAQLQEKLYSLRNDG